MRLLHRSLLSAACAAAFLTAFAQKKDTRLVPMCVGFYNVENLHDTIDDPITNDAEWLPTAPKQWNTAHYQRKLLKLAQVIGEMAKDVTPDGLACVGFAELENRTVLEDLVHTAPLDKRNYQIVHHDSPDRRGIDVGFIYNPKYFQLLSERIYPLRDPQDTAFRTRDQLVVSGVLDGDTVTFVVAHWPSRYGGEKISLPKRMLAGNLGRHIADSLMAHYHDARIIYMGDLNDDPSSPSLRKFLKVTGDKEKARDGMLFDAMTSLYEKGIGTLAYADAWNLFDQMILSPPLVTGEGGRYKFYGARVFNQPYLRQTDGPYAGYPLRTYVGDQYIDGYSDHFPVFIILVREAEWDQKPVPPEN